MLAAPRQCLRCATIRPPGKKIKAPHAPDRVIAVLAGRVVEHPKITFTDGRIVVAGSRDASFRSIPQ
jgi:hypothetical protein